MSRAAEVGVVLSQLGNRVEGFNTSLHQNEYTITRAQGGETMGDDEQSDSTMELSK